MATRILKYSEIVERLKQGEEIHWLGGIQPRAFMNFNETVRWDTFHRLWKDGLITDYGSPKLHGTVRLKIGIEA